MDFCLHYSGKLKSQDGAKGKHAIRVALHKQIRSVCLGQPFSTIFKEPVEEERDGVKPMFVQYGERRYWFLISEYLKTVADLEITLLLPHPVGAIATNGGDLDNRLKTLFDALRVPAQESEIPNGDSFNYYDGGMYCLFEDDKLIGRISIATYQDHDAAHKDNVRCFIQVHTRITAALFGNFQFM